MFSHYLIKFGSDFNKKRTFFSLVSLLIPNFYGPLHMFGGIHEVIPPQCWVHEVAPHFGSMSEWVRGRPTPCWPMMPTVLRYSGIPGRQYSGGMGNDTPCGPKGVHAKQHLQRIPRSKKGCFGEKTIKFQSIHELLTHSLIWTFEASATPMLATSKFDHRRNICPRSVCRC